MNKTIIWIAIVAVVLALVAVAVFWWPGLRGANAPSGPSTTPTDVSSGGPGITSIDLNRSAYQIALLSALKWEVDAALFKMESTDATGNDWAFTFVSPKAKGKAFEVALDGQSVASTSIVDLVDGGAPLPADLISPDDAIAQVRAIPGYGNADITSVEIMYNAAAQGWYWSIKMAGGVAATIKATP